MFDVWPFSHTSLFPLPLSIQVLTFSEHTAPNEPGQFCSLFVLGGAMKYSGLVLPWDQAGGCGFVSMPRPALLVHCPLRTLNCAPEGGNSGSPLPPNMMSHFLLFFTEGFSCFAQREFLYAVMPFLPPHCLIVAYLLYGYFQQVRVWDIALCGLCQFMTNGEVLHYTLSWAGEQVCFIHNLVDSNRLLRLGNWSRYYHTGPRYGERTGRNKLCIKAVVSLSLRQSYMGYNVTLPKATINSWLHGIQMFIFAQLKYNDKSLRDTIGPLARIGITKRLGLIYLGLGWVQSWSNLNKF